MLQRRREQKADLKTTLNSSNNIVEKKSDLNLPREGDQFVKMLYNFKSVKIPDCSNEAIEDGTLCPLGKFKEITNSLRPQNSWTEDCKNK